MHCIWARSSANKHSESCKCAFKTNWLHWRNILEDCQTCFRASVFKVGALLDHQIQWCDTNSH